MLKKKYISINNLQNYKHFLKKQYLKKKKIKLKNHFIQSNVLVEKNDFKILQTNFKNFFISKDFFYLNNNTNSIKNILYTIKIAYENELLLNFDFNRNIISFFNRLFLKFFFKKNKIIQGRIISNRHKKVYVVIFGIIFLIRAKNLHRFFSKKKKKFIRIRDKQKGFIYKEIKVKHLLKGYKFRHIYFKISIENKRIMINRISYLILLNEEMNKLREKIKKRLKKRNKLKLEYEKKLEKYINSLQLCINQFKLNKLNIILLKKKNFNVEDLKKEFKILKKKRLKLIKLIKNYQNFLILNLYRLNMNDLIIKKLKIRMIKNKIKRTEKFMEFWPQYEQTLHSLKKILI